MKISWFGLLRTGPALKSAIEKMTGTPGALESKQNWYNLVKASLALLAVCGIAAAKEFSDSDIAFISGTAAVAVPAALTLLDAGANFYLRIRKPDSKEALAKRKSDAAVRQG